MKTVIEIDGAQFGREMQSAKQPVLVHFYTSWSGPCRIVAPALETLAGELAGELNIRQATLDTHPELARRYHITEVPALILFDSGVPIAGFAGSISPRELKPQLQGLLADYAPPHARGNRRGARPSALTNTNRKPSATVSSKTKLTNQKGN
jgi:thioredoxin 1